MQWLKIALTNLGVFAVLLILLGAGLEVYLRTSANDSPKYRDYGDMTGIDIKSSHPQAGGYLSANIDEVVNDSFGGGVHWKTNSLGLRYHKELAPDKNVILSVGDSFAAGYRIGQQETYSAILETSLRAQGIEAQIPIAMTEEPTSALYHFQTFSKALDPKVVLFGITIGNDITQTLYYLGNKYHRPPHSDLLKPLSRKISNYWRDEFGEFQIPNECLVPTQAPSRKHRMAGLLITQRIQQMFKSDYQGEPITSYLGHYAPRMFDACHSLGHFLKRTPSLIERSYRNLFSILHAFQAQAKRSNTRLIVLIFPQRFQTQAPDWKATKLAYGLNESCFDLSSPNKRIMDFCESTSLECVDLQPALSRSFQETGQTHYLPNGDMHWNALGNKVVARELESLFDVQDFN